MIEASSVARVRLRQYYFYNSKLGIPEDWSAGHGFSSLVDSEDMFSFCWNHPHMDSIFWKSRRVICLPFCDQKWWGRFQQLRKHGNPLQEGFQHQRGSGNSHAGIRLVELELNGTDQNKCRIPGCGMANFRKNQQTWSERRILGQRDDDIMMTGCWPPKNASAVFWDQRRWSWQACQRLWNN